jgi:hypothetical protein
MGIKGARAMQIVDKLKKAKVPSKVTERLKKFVPKTNNIVNKNTQKLHKEFVPDAKNLINRDGSLKLIQDKPAFNPTGLSGKWSPVKGPYKEGGENAYSIGDSLDLTPDQIADLIRKGYDFEIE